ncbi:MAG TPA: GTPase, partial [Candidatus Omnitrophota bacterium]|nr:GTPase [Candidatus Omnitrophota bacterium]
AIVTDIAGTTRDTIEETLQIKGIPFQLVDTAGILEPRDLVEKEAIRRSHLSINSADLILLVVDGSDDLSPEDELLIQNISGKNVLVVLNKCDLAQKIFVEDIHQRLGDHKVIKVSALKKILIEDLEAAIVENVAHGQPMDTQTTLVSNVRHIQALKDCAAALARAQGLTQDGLSFEFVSEEVKLAVNFLDNLTGRNIDNDLLEKIFSEFCIGK